MSKRRPEVSPRPKESRFSSMVPYGVGASTDPKRGRVVFICGAKRVVLPTKQVRWHVAQGTLTAQLSSMFFLENL